MKLLTLDMYSNADANADVNADPDADAEMLMPRFPNGLFTLFFYSMMIINSHILNNYLHSTKVYRNMVREKHVL